MHTNTNLILKYYNKNENKSNNDSLKFKKYFLEKDNNKYKFMIIKKQKEIIIKNDNYENHFSDNDLSALLKTNFVNIDDAYEFIIKMFDSNNIIIKEIIDNQMMVLLVKLKNQNISEKIEICLLYNKKEKNNFIGNRFNNFELKTNEKDLNDTKINDNSSGVNNIHFIKNLSNDSFAYQDLDNTFCVFKSIYDIFYLIYSTKNRAIIAYNLIDNVLMYKIKNAHNEYISNFRSYQDIINERDLLISISCKDNNIKLWNINNWECLLNIKNVNKSGVLNSSCFLNINSSNIFILTSNFNFRGESDPIKIFDFNVTKIEEISNSNEETYFIDTYFSKKMSKYFIITGNHGYVKCYDYNENAVYKKYYDSDIRGHFSIIIDDDDKDEVKIIESSCDTYIRIWDFHLGSLLKKIKIFDSRIYGICLWSKEYLYVGCESMKIRLIELKTGKNIYNLSGHNGLILTLKKINIPQYGECLISQGYENDNIKLWS